MNFDGASKGNSGLSGFGAVIRDEEGNLVGEICGQAGFVSNNIAEITTLEEGLKWVTANGITKDERDTLLSVLFTRGDRRSFSIHILVLKSRERKKKVVERDWRVLEVLELFIAKRSQSGVRCSK
ncbi:uncharacterized protein LOC131071386 [Cryptomeria japonica]|uniref:uncharacterized protein LOC131071386 n=1 Tax=Cryptomeria japonica TaxID=3369 RepID=UPI0027DA0026|nr:uncharacterized protein LOC131071386 [Cryptomeria japonica]